jgi:hypothetical protein
MIRFLFLFLIRTYQVLFSPLKVTSCRYYPTCSQYAFESITLYGPLRGVIMGMKRLARCHPLHPGGYDPVVKPPFLSSSLNEWSISEWKKEH